MEAPEYGRYVTIGGRTFHFSSLHLLIWAIGLVFVGEVVLSGGINMEGGNLLRIGSIEQYASWAAGTSGWRSFFIPSEWWRAFTSMFLHLSIAHLLLNGMALYNLGRLADRIYGPTRLLLVFLVTGVAGSATSAIWSNLRHDPSWGAGASGAICGLLGLLLANMRSRPDPANQYVARQLLQWSLMILVFGILVKGIDNAAHVGGFVAGYLLARVLQEGYFDNLRGSTEVRIVRAATGVLSVTTVIALLVAGIGAKDRHETVTALVILNDELLSVATGRAATQIARTAVERIEVSDPEVAKLRDRTLDLLKRVNMRDPQFELTLVEIRNMLADRFPDRFSDWKR
ncbi:MAG: rhomboid family intramembrane serine protease [Planctomycetes bacterium]|nr:rhomboid family intramembrane serine protease [Planctomycetota bacterium]